MSERTLKPCPFCGGKPMLNITGHSEGYVDKNGVQQYTLSLQVVQCMNCGCEIYPHEKLDDAIEAWNRRVEDECAD